MGQLGGPKAGRVTLRPVTPRHVPAIIRGGPVDGAEFETDANPGGSPPQMVELSDSDQRYPRGLVDLPARRTGWGIWPGPVPVRGPTAVARRLCVVRAASDFDGGQPVRDSQTARREGVYTRLRSRTPCSLNRGPAVTLGEWHFSLSAPSTRPFATARPPPCGATA